MQPVSHDLTADLAVLTPYRLELASWLDAQSLHSAHKQGEILLVFVELLTNAIEASDPEGIVTIQWSSDETSTSLRFINRNPRLSAVELRSMPNPIDESGRGLALAQLFASRLDLHAAGPTVDITAHFNTSPPDQARIGQP